MEALYHVPLSLWAVGALYNGTYISFFFSISMHSVTTPSPFFPFDIHNREKMDGEVRVFCTPRNPSPKHSSLSQKKGKRGHSNGKRSIGGFSWELKTHWLTIGQHPLLPVHLLIYAVQTAITTLTCIAEYLSWTHLSVSEKINLGYLYVPYLALCTYPFFRFVSFSFRFVLVSFRLGPPTLRALGL